VGQSQYVVLLRAVRVGVDTQERWRRIPAILVLAAVPVSILALFQGFGAEWAQHLNFHLTGVNLGHTDRATGPFTGWQVLAGYLLAVGLVCTSIIAFDARRILGPRIAALVLVLIVAALARTLTVGALAGWIIGSAVLVVWAGRVHINGVRLAALAATAVVAFTLVLGARFSQEFQAAAGQAPTGFVPRTIVARYDHWAQQYLPALAGRWVTGFGPDFPATVTTKYTDSLYLTLLLRGGLILLAIYVALMACFVGIARSVSGLGIEVRSIAVALIVLVVVLTPLQVIATYFTTSGLPQVIWVLAALVGTASVLWPGQRRRVGSGSVCTAGLEGVG
jgi:hypothetical protein